MLEHGTEAQVVAIGSIDAIDHVDFFGGTRGDAQPAIPVGAVATIRGWGLFASDHTPCTGAFVSIDGGPPLELTYGLDRADVAQALQHPTAGSSGFRGIFSTAHLSLGAHVATVALRDDRGNLTYLEESKSFALVESLEHIVRHAAVVPGTSHVRIDVLSIDETPAIEPLRADAKSVLAIRGVALDPAAGAAGAAVFAMIGATAFRAFYEAQGGGFSIDVPLSRVVSGARLVSIFLVGADRKTVYAGPSLRLDIIDALNDKPDDRGLTLGSIDETAIVDRHGAIRSENGELFVIRGDKLFVRGWAIDEKNASPARSVTGIVDGVDARLAVYGLERSDVAASLRLPDTHACGFIFVLSTEELAYGKHILEFRVFERDGLCSYGLARKIDFSVVESIDVLAG